MTDDSTTDDTTRKFSDIDARLEALEAENRELKAKLDEQSAWPEMTRRGALGALAGAGGAALLGAGASDTAAATNAHGIRYVESGDTIQNAIDSFGGNWQDPAHVVVTPSYDPGYESFPITVWKRGVIRGSGFPFIENTDSSVDTIEVDFDRTDDVYNRTPGIILKDLAVKGGNHGINFVQGRYSMLQNVTVRDVAGDAYHFSDATASVAKNSHKMVTCFSERPGGHNVYCGEGVHGIVQVGCQHYFAGSEGVKVADGNYNSKMIGSGVEQADSYGLEIEGEAFSVHGGYFEDNYQSATPGQAEIQTSSNPTGFVIRDCYFQGLDNVQRAIRTFNGGSGIIEGCTYRNYTKNFIYLDDSSDVDVRRGTHTALDDTPFGGGSGSGVTRPRSHGVIGAQDGGMDLSGTTGKYPGDRGLDDGTNTTYGTRDLCVWTGSQWRQVGTGNTFT